jgi:uncharacterized DUF497 family protein
VTAGSWCYHGIHDLEGGHPLFDWDDDNRGHVRRHDVEPEDAEEALLDPRRIGAPAYNVGEERRWAYLGATELGRVLFVVFTKRGARIRVVTARDAETGELRRYRRRGE